MLNILKSKIIIYFAIFGAAFSFLLALFSGVSVFWLFIRILAGGILMGSLGFGLDFFLRQALSEDDYKALFRREKTTDNPPVESPKNIDMVDDTSLSPENEYKNLYSQEPDLENMDLSGTPAGSGYTPPPSSPNLSDEPGAFRGISSPQTQKPADSGFREEDLTAVPRVTQKPFEDDDGIPDSINPAQNELAKKESDGIPFKPLQASSSAGIDGSVKFNVGNKKITADPKVIAKAIKTVLQRDK